METSFINGPLVGSVLDFPSYTFSNQPIQTSTTKEQINSFGNTQTIIPILGNVATQVTGIFVNGINTTYPNALNDTLGPQQPPPAGQQGFTGTIGG